MTIRVHRDGSIEASSPEEAVAISKLLADGEVKDARPAGGIESKRRETGGRKGRPAGGRADDGSRGERARRGAQQRGEDARPASAEKGPSPAPRRPAKRGGDVVTEKRCSACEKTRPAAAFPLRPNGRLQSWCRECYRAYHDGRKKPPTKKAPPTRKAPPAQKGRAPEETPADRLARLRERAQATRDREQATRAPVRCKLVGPNGKACGAVVMSHKATQHAYEAHKKNVPIELMGSYFERAPEGAEAVA